jgi:DNA-binding NarL/FixJ family response regulator
VSDLKFVVYSEQDEFGSEIQSRLQAAGHAHVVAVVSDEDALFAALREHKPDALFADLGLAPHDALDLLDPCRRRQRSPSAARRMTAR